MGLYETLEEVLADDGPLGETANRIAEAVTECLNGVADKLDGLSEKLDEIGVETAEGGDEGPSWEARPELRAIKTATDSIIGIVDSLSDTIDAAREKLEAAQLTGCRSSAKDR
jgi:hypothetical protein